MTNLVVATVFGFSDDLKIVNKITITLLGGRRIYHQEEVCYDVFRVSSTTKYTLGTSTNVYGFANGSCCDVNKIWKKKLRRNVLTYPEKLCQVGRKVEES